jgi:hypothetical protein
MVPKLEHVQMKKPRNIREEDLRTYWKYPSVSGKSWADKFNELIGSAKEIGVEPTVRQEVAAELKEYSLRIEPLVER